MLVVIQGTSFCNINCSYCYLPDRTRKKCISMETIRQLVARLAEAVSASDEISVVWHAGEPLVLPIAFYEEAFASFAPLHERGIKLTHSFQTNGTLIDERWTAFFLRYGPIVGVSIDGPKDIHDLNRCYRNGTGSWERCMSGVRQLQAARVPFHTISVLTEPALRRPDRMFDFFRDMHLHDIGFNIEEAEGANIHSSLQLVDYEELHGSFLRRFLRRNAEAGHPLRLREAEGAAAAILAGGIPYNAQVERGRIISVDVDGNVTTFSPELLGLKDERFSNFVIGNVWEHSIAEMLAGPVARILTQAIGIGTENCRASCEFFPFCKGGAPVNKLCETGSFETTETMYCRLTVKSTIRECVDALFSSLPAAHLRTGVAQ